MSLVLVTGAERPNSIAAAIIPRLKADGWDVVTSELRSGDYPCDLASPTAPSELVERVSRDRGPIHALVLSHAHDEESGILDTTAESFDRHLAVNARATLLLISAFARQVDETGGAIVAFTSDHTTGNLPYGASKGALDRIVISAARERRESGPDQHRLDGCRDPRVPGRAPPARSVGDTARHRRDHGVPPVGRGPLDQRSAPPHRRRLLRAVLSARRADVRRASVARSDTGCPTGLRTHPSNLI
jgi:hypothetical protein